MSADSESSTELFGPQQHPVPRLEHCVADPARVQLRLAPGADNSSRAVRSISPIRSAQRAGDSASGLLAAGAARAGQRQAWTRAAVDEQGCEPAAESRGRVVDSDGQHREGQLSVPVVLAPVGVGAQAAQRVTDGAVGTLDLGVGVRLCSPSRR
jgi:hypothetical protein